MGSVGLTSVKVVILVPSHWGARTGGSEFRAHCLADFLVSQDCEVTYLTRNPPLSGEQYAYPITAFAPPRALRRLRWGFAPDSVSLFRALNALNPDVIIQLVACAHTGVAAYWAKRHNKLMFWYLASDMDVEKSPNIGVNGPARILDGLLFRYGRENCSHIVCQTRFQKHRLLETTGRSAVAVIPNFHPAPQHAVEAESVFTAVWVANFKPLKQPQVFLQLAEDLRHENIKFCMIGRLENSTWGKSIRQKIQQQTNVEFMGEMDMDSVNRQIGASHVLVNTSEYEGFPNTFIQAWMRGVPTLSLNVDPDGVIEANGLGKKTGDYENIRHELLSLKNDVNQYDEASRRCMDFAKTNHSMQNASQLLTLIQRELDG